AILGLMRLKRLSVQNVPEYAGGHHERMDGKGYPRGLTREQMSLQARMMGIADIFEALTAADRPYKSGMTLSQAIAIMCRMRDNGHIDPDLFEVFVRERVYLRYGEQFLEVGQVDAVDVTAMGF
ncbi:TPA: HD-GYP domain-containing protein, partial [Pseudomonas aeruginosa]